MSIDISYGEYASSKIIVLTRKEKYNSSAMILSEDEAIELHHFLGKLLKEKGLV